jgi:SARP family transcriptional regulator, regulator of embCAB operon
MEILVLGTIEVRTAGRRLGAQALGGRKPKQLLELLVAARGRWATKDTLTEGLWPERPPRRPAAALENHVWVLRRHLAEVETGAQTALVAGPGAYRLDTTIVDLDLDRFDDLVRAGDALGPVARRPRREEALALVRGDLFEDEPDADWALAQRERYRRQVLRVLIDAAEGAALSGDVRSTMELAVRAMEHEPLSERGCQLLMWALAEAGEREQALRAYDAIRAALGAELGVQPLAGTVGLYEHLRAGHHLDWPAATAGTDRVGGRAPR